MVLKENTILGNIFEIMKSGDGMIQGLNCCRRMGAGIALQTVQKYPEIGEEDKNRNYVLKHNMLRESWLYLTEDSKYMIQSYMQFYPGNANDSRQNGYIRDGLINGCKILLENNFSGTFYIPEIGCGYAGGDWDNVVYPLIVSTMKLFPTINYVFVKYSKNTK